MNSDLLDASDAVGSVDPLTGEVKWFDVKKGFGFIVAPDGRDVFVHFSSILGDGFRSLKDGEVVQYEMTHGDKGLHAKNVRRDVRTLPAGRAAPDAAGHDSMQHAAQRTRSPDAAGQAAE